MPAGPDGQGGAVDISLKRIFVLKTRSVVLERIFQLSTLWLTILSSELYSDLRKIFFRQISTVIIPSGLL